MSLARASVGSSEQQDRAADRGGRGRLDGRRRALLWVAEEASLRGASLDVVHTYGSPEDGSIVIIRTQPAPARRA